MERYAKISVWVGLDHRSSLILCFSTFHFSKWRSPVLSLSSWSSSNCDSATLMSHTHHTTTSPITLTFQVSTGKHQDHNKRMKWSSLFFVIHTLLKHCESSVLLCATSFLYTHSLSYKRHGPHHYLALHLNLNFRLLTCTMLKVTIMPTIETTMKATEWQSSSSLTHFWTFSSVWRPAMLMAQST